MKLKRPVLFVTSLLLSLSSLSVFAPIAHAATVAWDGEGSDNKFSTAANWAGDVVPSSGDVLTFPASVDSDTTSGDDRILVNDLTGLSVGGVQVTGTFATGDYDQYKITGSALTTTGAITGGSSLLQLTVDITAGSALQLTNVISTKNLSTGSNNVGVVDSYFEGGITGSGTIIVDGNPDGGSGRGAGCPAPSSTPFGGDSSGFTGAIIIESDGALVVTASATDFARSVSTVTLNTDGFLSFATKYGEDMAYGKPLIVNGGIVNASQYPNTDSEDCASPTTNKTVTLSGNMNFTADTTFRLNKTDIKFTGTVTGKEHIKVAEGYTGSVSFSDGSKLDSAMRVTTITDVSNCNSYTLYENSKTIFNTDCTSTVGVTNPTPVTGTIGGSGKVGKITIASTGHLAPGNSPGILNTGDLAFEAGGTYDFEVGGTDPGTGYDQTKVTGTVNLGNGTLKVVLYQSFAPVKGQSYVIIDNDAADAVTGTFKDLAEGATFVSDNVTYKVSYVGGDGNDVVLTVISATAPNTGLRLGGNNPVIVLMFTTGIAGALIVLSRRKAFAKVSR